LNLSQTVDLAAHLIAHADHILHDSQRIDDQHLHEYWVHSRDLSHHWMQNLSVCQRVLENSTHTRQRQCWLEYEPDLRDILRVDVLHRVWYLILRSADIEQKTHHSEPIARSALTAQMQVRIRCLKLILVGHKIDAAQTGHLNELRKNAEKWSDFLCGHLAKSYGVDELLFDKQRAHLWGEKRIEEVMPELNRQDFNETQCELNQLLIHNPDASESLYPIQRLTQTMLHCFPESAFDENGLLKSFDQDA